jgi:hypothetical protein
MDTQAIVEQIEAEISRLLQAKMLLCGTDSTEVKHGRGRPKKRLTSKGRKAISDAMKKRWSLRRETKKAYTGPRD